MTNLEEQSGEVAGTDETQQAAMIAEGSPAPAAEAATGGEVADANAGAEPDPEPDTRTNDIERAHAQNKAAIEAEAAKRSAPLATVGRLVQYRLTSEDAHVINRRRGGITDGEHWPHGAVAHFGNYANEHDVLPMLVVKVWGPDYLNGQVFLDGNDTLWKTSVSKSGPGELRAGQWQWPTLG